MTVAGVVDTIKKEHRDIAHVLKVLQQITARLATKRVSQDVDRLYDICHYLRVFPDQVHHPKEERYVFGPLRSISSRHGELLEQIWKQHDECAAMTNRLSNVVHDYDRGESKLDELEAVVTEYTAFQFNHMRTEEQQVLPLVDRLLDTTTLSHAHSAFARHGDPLFGENVHAGFEALRRRIFSADET